jgi:hypothetical protein
MTLLNEPDAAWLKVAEAAPRLGLTVDGLRSRIKRGLVTTKRGNDGRVLVNVAMNGSITGHEPGHELATDTDELARLLVQLEEARERAEGAVTEAAEARERAARAEGRAEALLGQTSSMAEHLAAERARGDRLELALAEARKGWLERLLEAVRRR